MNKNPGIDTHPADFFVIGKIDLPFDDQAPAITALKALDRVTKRLLDPARTHGPNGTDRTVVGYWRTNLLVGFGLTFFAREEDRSFIPSFPPEGEFPRRRSTRFGMLGPVPKYLRKMNALGDRRWVEKRMEGTPSAEAVDAAYAQWLRAGESDLIIVAESDNRFLVTELWSAIYEEVVRPHGLRIRAVHEAFNRGDGRDHSGFVDGVSNLDDMMRDDPESYRRKIYLPRSGPAYPGENAQNHDPLTYNGGTYLVHRKYAEHLELFNDEKVTFTERDGRVFHGDAARSRMVGRDRHCGRVLRASDNAKLEAEANAAEVKLAPLQSHILQARGGSPSHYGDGFPPTKPGEVRVFNTQDIRIRRRGCNYWEIDSATGKSRQGLHFMCFQNNIQQTGFEFINNIWLMNEHFHLGTDSLLDPENGYIEPLEGAYYFVAPSGSEFPGDVFFRRCD